MWLKRACFILFSALLIVSCDSSSSDQNKIECYWYENIAGEFQSLKKTQCSATNQYAYDAEYLEIDGSFYYAKVEKHHYSCGFYQQCSTQSNHFYLISDDLTLRDLGNGYAINQDYVYYLGGVLEHASPDTFEIIETSFDKTYAKDHQHVYFNGALIPTALAASFQLLSKDYSYDAERVYYRGQEIVGADPNSFTIIELPHVAYSKDQYSVFWETKVIVDADPATFKVAWQEDQFASWFEDHENLYYINQKIPIDLDVRNIRHLLTGRRGEMLITDGNYILLASSNSGSQSYSFGIESKEACSAEAFSVEECLQYFDDYERFITENRWIINPGKEGYDLLGLKQLEDIAHPLQAFTQSSIVDGNGQIFYFDMDGNFIKDPRFNRGNLQRLPLSCELPAIYQIAFDCDLSQKIQAENHALVFHEDDEAIYAMAVKDAKGTIEAIEPIILKDGGAIDTFNIPHRYQYVIQGRMLYLPTFDFYDDKGFEVYSVEIEGEMKGVFKGYHGSQKFVDEGGIIHANTLQRDFSAAEFGPLRAFHKPWNGKGMLFENDYYVFLMYPVDSDKASLIINKETGQVNYMDWGIDVTSSINAGFLEFLEIDVLKE